MSVKQSFKYFGVALVAGGLGALVGILLAPASGRETRRALLRRMDEAKADLIKKGERVVERVADRVEEQLKEVRRKVA